MIRVGLLCSADPILLVSHGLYLAELMQSLARYPWRLVYRGEPSGLVERARYYAEFYRIPYEGHATHSDLPLRTHELMYDSERARHTGFLDACDAVLVLVGGVETYHELFHVLHENASAHAPKPVCVLDPTGRFASLRTILASLRTPGVTWCDRIEEVGAWVSRALATQHPEHQ